MNNEMQFDPELLRHNYEDEYPFKLGEFENFAEINKVYHYTTIDAVKSIILTKRFWLSNCLYLNDNLELSYTSEIINQVYNKFDNSGVFKDLINIYNSTALNLNNMFILSLSYDKDNITLWYNYARNEGYNLGFNLESLISLFKLNASSFGILTKSTANPAEVNGTALFDKVLYDKSKQVAIIEDVFKKYECAIQGVKNPRIIANLTILTVHRLLICSLFFKNYSFSPEKEFRIVLNLHNGFEKVIHHRISHGLFIPYIEIGITPNSRESLPIDSICIGPKNNYDLAQNGLISFLKYSGYAGFNNICSSEVPLRY